MAQNDDRYIPRVPNNLNEVADLLRDIWEVLHALEGRVGPISLRDDLSVMGGVTATGDLETNVTTDGSVELDNFIQINERVFDAEGVLTPTVSSVGSSRIYMNPLTDKLLVSENGGAYTNLVPTIPTLPSEACRITNSIATTLADSTLTALSFDTERYDTAALYSGGAPTRITIPTAGIYNIGSCIQYAFNTTGYRFNGIRLNGANFLAAQLQLPVTTAATGTDITLNVQWQFSVGDYVELMAFQNSGGGLDVTKAADFSPEFWATRIQ